MKKIYSKIKINTRFTEIFSKRQRLLFGLIFLVIVVIPVVYITLRNAVSTTAAWYNTDWLYRKRLSFNNSAQSSDLSNFPVLVTLTSSNFDFTQAKEAGEDIRFTDSNGSTLLPYEIESYDSSGQNARIWVKVPQIDGSSTTDSIFIYWGNSGASDAQDADNTWNSNYKAVYHLNNNTGSTTVTDSSGLGNDITSSENTNNGFYKSSGIIGGAFQTGGTPTYITDQSGQNIAEVYPDIVLDSSGYPVIAYTDNTNYDLILVHCNDKECKGADESVSIVDSVNSTGAYPSLLLDSNGYPMIAYYYASAGDLKYVHCNDVNCAGGDETFSVIDTSGTTGYYPKMAKDSSGYPVIAYYYASGADLRIVHCGNANCTSGNVINDVDTGGTVGNGFHGTDLVLDSSGYPVMSYYDTTNTELKVAHCNDVNCSGGDESINSPLSTLGLAIGLYTSIQLDGSGLPMIAYYNSTNLNMEFLHCDDVSCAGDETANRVIVATGTYDYQPDLEKNSSGNPVIVTTRYGNIVNTFVCSNTNCSSSTQTYLSLYNQTSSYASFKLDADNNMYIVAYSQGKTGDYDTLLFTTKHKLERAYDSDFDFGTGSFSVSAWFKSSGMVQKNILLSRYDADQGYKIELNYAGQACFGIDDDASWGPDDSACSSDSQVSTNVDSGYGSSINWHSMVLDGNGYPIIAYFDDGTDDLEMVHCNDVNCAGSDETYASIDTAGDVGRTPSMVLDTNGYPVIAYHDNSNQDLKIVHCGNANCSSGNTINTVDNSADDVGDYPTLKLDGNGYPVISYYDNTNTAVKLVHCNDVNCSGGNESIVTLVNDEDDRVRHGSESLQLDTDGYPMVVYTDITNYDLKYIHCNDANCDGVGETKTTIESAYSVGDFASMTLDSNGYPVIVHYDASFLNPRLVHCGDINCSSGNVANAINTPNSGASGYYELDIKLNASGNPVILSYQMSSWSAILTVCNDANCSGGDETNSIIRESNYNYNYHSLALDSNSYPVISYAASGNDLRLIHMNNTTTYTQTGNYDDGNWHHLVAVKNGTSSITIYVDGVAVGTDTSLAAGGTLTSDSASLNLAEEITNSLSSNNWTGYLDEVQIDNTARSSDWVAAEYLSESNNFINTSVTENGPAAVNLSTYSGDTENIENYLIGYWKFDEGYDTTAYNSGSGGSNLNGSLVNMASPPTSTSGWNNNGKFGKSLSFDGSNDNVSLGSNTAYDSTSFTYSMWIKPISLKNTYPGDGNSNIIMGRENYLNSGFRYGLVSTGKVVFWTTQSGGTLSVNSGSTVIPTGSYSHVVITYDADSSTGRLYIDGMEVGNSNGTYIVPTGYNLKVFSGVGGVTFPQAEVDEVKVYNVALTADQVKTDYNQGSATVLGLLSDNSSYEKGSGNQEYCVPGDTTSCTPPVAEWKFEEGNSATAHDTSGNEYVGTLQNTPTWTEGKVGTALEFDGSDYISTSLDLYDLYNAGGFTIEAWSFHTATGSYDTIASSFKSSPYEGFFLRTNSTGSSMECSMANAGSFNVASTTNEQNTWIHWTCTYSGGVMKIYKNGVYQSQDATSSMSDAGNTLLIGADYAGSENWAGKIDQVRVYNYARSAAQVSLDYDQGGPVGWWKFDECQGNIAHDSTSYGNNGTISISTAPQTEIGDCSTPGTAWGDGATGKINASLNFDGTSDTVSIPATVPIAKSNQLTVTQWYKPNGGSDPRIISRGWCAAHGWLSHKSYGFGVNDATGCSAQYLASYGSMTNGQWYFLVGVFDGSKVYAYKNGVLINQTDAPGVDLSNNNYATSLMTNDSGQLDDVRIYNYALTPTQINSIYNNGAINYSPSTGSP